MALFEDPAATLDDLREAVTTLEETTRIARRVFGGAHPLTTEMVIDLRHVRAMLRPRDTPSPEDAAAASATAAARERARAELARDAAAAAVAAGAALAARAGLRTGS